MHGSSSHLRYVVRHYKRRLKASQVRRQRLARMNTERLSPRYADIDALGAGRHPRRHDRGPIGLGGGRAGGARRPSSRRRSPSRPGCASSGRLIYAGAGTSGRLAVQDGAELMPTFSWPPERLLLLLAGGDEAMTQAVEGAEDDTARAAELIDEHGVDATDVLIAVAASGTTPFTLACLREARPPRRLDGRHRQQPRHAAARRGRAPDPACHRARADRRLDAHERRHGAAHHAQSCSPRW